MHGCDVIQKQVCPHNYRLTEIGNIGEGMQAGGAEVLTEGDGETLQPWSTTGLNVIWDPIHDSGQYCWNHLDYLRIIYTPGTPCHTLSYRGYSV